MQVAKRDAPSSGGHKSREVVEFNAEKARVTNAGEEVVALKKVERQNTMPTSGKTRAATATAELNVADLRVKAVRARAATVRHEAPSSSSSNSTSTTSVFEFNLRGSVRSLVLTTLRWNLSQRFNAQAKSRNNIGNIVSGPERI